MERWRGDIPGQGRPQEPLRWAAAGPPGATAKPLAPQRLCGCLESARLLKAPQRRRRCRPVSEKRREQKVPRAPFFTIYAKNMCSVVSNMGPKTVSKAKTGSQHVSTRHLRRQVRGFSCSLFLASIFVLRIGVVLEAFASEVRNRQNRGSFRVCLFF